MSGCVARSEAFAVTHLPQLEGVELRAKQFSTGTSNPTYLVFSGPRVQTWSKSFFCLLPVP